DRNGYRHLAVVDGDGRRLGLGLGYHVGGGAPGDTLALLLVEARFGLARDESGTSSQPHAENQPEGEAVVRHGPPPRQSPLAQVPVTHAPPPARRKDERGQKAKARAWERSRTGPT